MNQREATVKTVLSVLADRDVEYVLNGDTPISDVLTDTDKSTIRSILFTQFMNEEIDMKPDSKAKYLTNDAELKKYVSGLLNNWIRKAKEFNGGNVYVAKNPGSRQHSQDEQLKELKKLSAQCAGNDEAMKEVADAIVKRKAELEAEKAKSTVINADVIPEALKHLIKN